MKFNSIQVLRAIAALSVLLFHIQFYLVSIGNLHNSVFHVFGNIFSYGAILFFGISGFLMTHLIETGYKNFLIRRITRIYPIYILLVASIISAKLLFKGIPVPTDIVASVSLLPFGHVSYQLGIEWTLVYEIFFYIICSVFTIGITRKYFHLFLWVWLGIVLIANNFSGITPQVFPTIEVIFFQIFNMFFIVGGLTYYGYKKISFLNNSIYFSFLGIVIAVFFCWPILETTEPFSHYIYYIFAVCLVVILLAFININATVPECLKKLFIKLGDYSYALYLIHVQITIFVFKSWGSHFHNINITTAFFALAICLFASWWVGKFDVFLHNHFKKQLTPPFQGLHNINNRLQK